MSQILKRKTLIISATPIFFLFGFLILNFSLQPKSLPLSAEASENLNILKFLPETLERINPTTFEIDLSYQDRQSNPIIGQEKFIVLELFVEPDYLVLFHPAKETKRGTYRIQFRLPNEILEFSIRGSVFINRFKSVFTPKIKIKTFHNTLIIASKNFRITPDFLWLKNIIGNFKNQALPLVYAKRRSAKAIVWVPPDSNLDRSRIGPKIANANDMLPVKIDHYEIRRISPEQWQQIDRNQDNIITHIEAGFDRDTGDLTFQPGEILNINEALPLEKDKINMVVMPEISGISEFYGVDLKGAYIPESHGDFIALQDNITSKELGHEVAHYYGEDHPFEDPQSPLANDRNNLMNYDPNGTELTKEQRNNIEGNFDGRAAGEINTGNEGEIIGIEDGTPGTGTGNGDGKLWSVGDAPGKCYNSGAARPGGYNTWAPCCNCGIHFHSDGSPHYHHNCRRNGAGCDIQLGCLNLHGRRWTRPAIWDPETGICGVG